MSLQYYDQPEVSIQEHVHIPSDIVHIQPHLRVDKPDTIMREKVHVTATDLLPHEHYKMSMK